MASYPDFIILAEAIALALPVEIGLRCLPLDALIARLEGAARFRDRSRCIDVERVAQLIERAARFYPFQATCLKKSLILLRILRRRGIPAELRLGVRKVQDDLNSHAWIHCEGQTLLGGGVEHLYATLPPAPDPRNRKGRPRASRAPGKDLGNESTDVLR